MNKVLILGGTGSLGHMLAEMFKYKYELYVYSRGEDAQWRMKNKYPKITFTIGDIADKNRLQLTLDKIQPNYIIIAAALKHIDICEFNSSESIKTNIIGIQNVVDTICEKTQPQLKSVVFISTDKACSPVNVYGMCKALGERIVIEKSTQSKNTRFLVVRYGNVLNSRGSILPKFHEIGKDDTKSSFKVTSKDMTRFFMTLEDSVFLIEYAMLNGKTGHTYIPMLASYKIDDIAQEFGKLYNKRVEYTGIRPGEKIDEVLINSIEFARTKLLKEFIGPLPSRQYYEIAPVTENQTIDTDFTAEYTSKNHLCTDKGEIQKLLAKY